ncbi:MAG: Ig-like domain-containing protein [Lachnospiraceae bacterium]|nr:Ig-like domain-containing protein [Lachnospiraceae bacterium]
MKQNRFKKGIITLVFLLSVSFFSVFASATDAYANTQVPKLNVKTKAIVKGKDYALKVYNLSETQTVTFTSLVPKVATVNEEGIVKALAVGTTTVTAVIEDSASDETLVLECKIRVGTPAFHIMLSRQQLDMTVGQRSLLSYMIAPFNTAELPKFSSSDPEVASVSAGGVVTAKSAGTAYIFAQIDNGLFSACSITVTEEEEEAIVPRTFNETEESEENTFADFLINLNSNFTNGDNTSEDTGAEPAQ